jgi:hypothetical protein
MDKKPTTWTKKTTTWTNPQYGQKKPQYGQKPTTQNISDGIPSIGIN